MLPNLLLHYSTLGIYSLLCLFQIKGKYSQDLKSPRGKEALNSTCFSLIYNVMNETNINLSSHRSMEVTEITNHTRFRIFHFWIHVKQVSRSNNVWKKKHIFFIIFFFLGGADVIYNEEIDNFDSSFPFLMLIIRNWCCFVFIKIFLNRKVKFRRW